MNYPESLGKLIGNLHSLEFALRGFLLNLNARGGPPRSAPDYYQLRVGDPVDENEFSDWATLGGLIDRFNVYVLPRDRAVAIDTHTIELRDLLAHGRVFSKTADVQTLRIVKFAKPRSGKVVVTASAFLDEHWFSEKTGLVFEQLMKIQTATQKYASAIGPD
jgi:hypothetical protein